MMNMSDVKKIMVRNWGIRRGTGTVTPIPARIDMENTYTNSIRAGALKKSNPGTQ